MTNNGAVITLLQKREYKVGETFSIGRGFYQVCHADRRYYFACTDCHLRNRKSCRKMACKALEREDGKDVVFVLI